MTKHIELRNAAIAEAAALVLNLQNEVLSRVRRRGVISRGYGENTARFELVEKISTALSNMTLGGAHIDKEDTESTRSPLVLSFDWEPGVSQDGPADTGEAYNSTACSSNAVGPYRVPTAAEAEKYHRRIRSENL